MPLLVQGFDNCQREAFGIKMWFVGCVSPLFCSGFPACSLVFWWVLEWVTSQALGVVGCTWEWLWQLDGRWANLPQQASGYWGRRILSFFRQLCCLLWTKSVDFEIWLLQPLSAQEFLCYRATGCTCALRCCRVRAQILWGAITASMVYASFLLYFGFLFGQRGHLCLNIRQL